MDSIFKQEKLIEYNSNLAKLKNEFNYQTYITPYSESREMLGRIIEELQYFENSMRKLFKYALKNNLLQKPFNFDIDNYISTTKALKSLTPSLIDQLACEKMLDLVCFRNYIIHEHYTSNNRKTAEQLFPLFLFMIFEAEDYIQNVLEKVQNQGLQIHRPNIFD